MLSQNYKKKYNRFCKDRLAHSLEKKMVAEVAGVAGETVCTLAERL